jgi:hypothetical protein
VEGTQKCVVDDKGVNETLTQADEVIGDLDRQISEINERNSKRAIKH